MPLTWVVGSSGLIGKAVWRRGLSLGHELRRAPVPWMAGEAEQLAALDEGLAALAQEAAGRSWNLIWVAGAGVVGTSAEVLEVEARVLSGFLDRLAAASAIGAGPRAVFMASSAGGVYAGSSGPPFSETTDVAPLAPYGHQKVRIEAAAKDFAREAGVPTVVGRLTNVYGPGQDLGKAQGLISQLAKASILHKPISLYVSLDTIRDYIYVDDAAAVILAALHYASAAPELCSALDPSVTKIIGSGTPLTIAALIGEFSRVLRRRPPLVLGDSPNRRFQVRDLRMRSTTWTHLDRHTTTTLPTGIAATVADLSQQLRSGGLASH